MNWFYVGQINYEQCVGNLFGEGVFILLDYYNRFQISFKWEYGYLISLVKIKQNKKLGIKIVL